MLTYDVVIIGAGPAGLSAGYTLLEKGINFVIVDQGKIHKERSRFLPYDVSYGFGGGGLFSDGKFSYPPAASQLWTKLNSHELREAYNGVWNLFNEANIVLDEWNDEWTESVSYTGEKKYKSIRILEKQRDDLMDLLYLKLKDRIKFDEAVTKVSVENEKYIVSSNDGNVYIANSVIIATGKKGYNEFLQQELLKDARFYCEMGIRLEVNSGNFMVGSETQIDYKLIEPIDESTEARTFCCCRDGEVRESLFGNHLTYNGETTECKTGYSNIGILVRTTDPNSVYAQEMGTCFESGRNQRIRLSQFNEHNEVIGKKTDDEIRNQIKVLIRSGAEGTIYGPEIEKYGYYPFLDENLQANSNLYFVGDATGTFRGLMAAFVSGAYAGGVIVERKKKSIREYMDILNIKQSDTKEMKLIFTAQSKAYFYCRDVVCQYVLNQECLPINPFRVFEYFLGDRVDRDLIRRGNNQLIRTCEELWVFGNIADGVLFEIASAIEQGKKIRFFTIGTRIEDIKEIAVDDVTFEPEVHSRKIKRADLLSFIKDYGFKDNIDYETQINWLDFLEYSKNGKKNLE